MKYITIFLLLISTVYSLLEEDKCVTQYNKLIDKQGQHIECIEAIFNKVPEQANYTFFCSEKCKNLLSDIKKNAPDCYTKDTKESLNDDSKLDIRSNLNIIEATVHSTCATDEAGNYCPNTQALIDKDFATTKEQTEEIARKSCKSKQCTDALLEILMSRKYFGDDNYLQEGIDILNSKECRDQNSSSISFKIGSSLILSMALFFIYLF